MKTPIRKRRRIKPRIRCAGIRGALGRRLSQAWAGYEEAAAVGDTSEGVRRLRRWAMLRQQLEAVVLNEEEAVNVLPVVEEPVELAGTASRKRRGRAGVVLPALKSRGVELVAVRMELPVHVIEELRRGGLMPAGLLATAMTGRGYQEGSPICGGDDLGTARLVHELLRPIAREWVPGLVTAWWTMRLPADLIWLLRDAARKNRMEERLLIFATLRYFCSEAVPVWSEGVLPGNVVVGPWGGSTAQRRGGGR